MLLHTTYWVYTLLVNWCGPIEVGPLYTWGLNRCLAFFICLSYFLIVCFVQSKPDFYCLKYCSGTLIVLTVLSVFLKQ